VSSLGARRLVATASSLLFVAELAAVRIELVPAGRRKVAPYGLRIPQTAAAVLHVMKQRRPAVHRADPPVWRRCRDRLRDLPRQPVRKSPQSSSSLDPQIGTLHAGRVGCRPLLNVPRSRDALRRPALVAKPFRSGEAINPDSLTAATSPVRCAGVLHA